MPRHIIILLFCFLASTAFGQKKFKGRVFENETRIGLSDVFIENTTNKQSVFTDAKGRFSITAKVGDILTFKGFAYQHDTVLITDLNEKEIFLIPKKNQLAQVNITTTETSNMNTYYDPLYHGQTMVYQRDKKGYATGGIVLRMWYWKKDEKKKAKLQKQLKDFETMDKIAAVFNAKSLSRYVPLEGQDMQNFISLYTPSIKAYTKSNFELIPYLNDCYKKYQDLPADKRSPEPLLIN